MAEDSIAKTAITCPIGLWEWLVVPFGLRNAAQSFQRLMDNIFSDVSFVVVHIDDILVYSKTVEEHQILLDKVFSLL